ncbi:hypothetical protein COO60DRAFT_1294920 [Scenedesmus sp. NREL 46B-D3]|nr:hypothetical protein COO60DRAFT_1294920 [Scenedesmus sp. NREL 46B-D3]
MQAYGMRHRPVSDLGQARRLGCASRPLLRCQPATSSHSRAAAAAGKGMRWHASTHTPAVRVTAMQSGWQPQPQQQQQVQPQPPLQQQQQQQPNRQLAPMARGNPYPASPVYLELTQVLSKQVVTRTSGRSLGTISGAWLDPARGTLVSFDLDDRRPGSGSGLVLSSPARAGNIPLSALRQIGDVVLVHDESGLYEQDLDGRLGFVNPVGLGVRTRTGEFLGKVRDLSFSPDSGSIARITYDEFGLPFLPISFFDCYSVAMQDVLSIGRSDLIVYDDAKYRERKESSGLFAAIPSLLKSLNGGRGGGGSPQLALPAPASGTSDIGRYLPADYTYEQWQADLRRWEAETGMTYEQYLRWVLHT